MENQQTIYECVSCGGISYGNSLPTLPRIKFQDVHGNHKGVGTYSPIEVIIVEGGVTLIRGKDPLGNFINIMEMRSGSGIFKKVGDEVYDEFKKQRLERALSAYDPRYTIEQKVA